MSETELERRRYAVELLKRAEDRLEVAITPAQIALTAKLVDLIEADIGDWLEARATGVLADAPRSAEVLRTVGRAIAGGAVRRHRLQPDELA
jgi:hypothetical protein